VARDQAATTPAVTRRAQARLGIALVAPLAVLVAVFFLLPLASAIYFSLVDFHGFEADPPFVGLANFAELASDSALVPAFRNNVVWIIVGTAAPLVIGLLVALLLWNIRRGSTFYRVAFFLPYVLPATAIGVVWSWIYDPLRGWLNEVLKLVGLGSFATGWLGNPDTALAAVLLTAVWTATGFVMVVFLAALRNVDVELIDAATIDGASEYERLRYVILPQIMPVFIMVTTITLIGGFSVFDIVFVMTGGGPAGATEVLGTYAYRNAFELNRMSYGTALALVIAVLAVPFTIGLNRLQRRMSLYRTGA
jgi:raffinose/stachyose/melibiose transport system permease protein